MKLTNDGDGLDWGVREWICRDKACQRSQDIDDDDEGMKVQEEEYKKLLIESQMWIEE